MDDLVRRAEQAIEESLRLREQTAALHKAARLNMGWGRALVQFAPRRPPAESDRATAGWDRARIRDAGD